MTQSTTKLTKRKIDSFSYQGHGVSRDVRWDGLIPGFGIRIYPSGRKTFVLSYRCNGRKRLMSLGVYGVITLDEARDLARKALVNVASDIDPLDQRQLAIQGDSVADLCQAFMDRHAKPHKRSWKDDESRIRLYIVPAWGTLKASSLKRSDVARIHRKLGEQHPYAANRLLELISKMYELGRIWAVVADDHPNPARGIPKFKEEKRDRWITPQELPRLARAIDLEPNRPARAALWLYLLTGLRKSELLPLRWSDIDEQRQEIRIGMTKSGRPHYVPLSEEAREILRSLPREEGNPYVFQGTKPGRDWAVSGRWSPTITPIPPGASLSLRKRNEIGGLPRKSYPDWPGPLILSPIGPHGRLFGCICSPALENRSCSRCVGRISTSSDRKFGSA